MPYHIQFFDNDDVEALKKEHFPAHVAFLEANQDKLLAAGPLTGEDGEGVGGVIIVDVDTKEEADAFAASDPLASGGVRKGWESTRWRAGFLDRKRPAKG